MAATRTTHFVVKKAPDMVLGKPGRKMQIPQHDESVPNFHVIWMNTEGVRVLPTSYFIQPKLFRGRHY
jgi:hypothetical protein